jgi:superfamily II DNA or RNA helicase
VPRIFDNIAVSLLPALRETLERSYSADFCVGYFNLRGWKLIDRLIDAWPGGEGACCRLLVGMQRPAEEEVRAAFSLAPDDGIDQQTVLRLKRQMAEEFRTQLTLGAPNNGDEAGLRRLSRQLRERKVVVKLYLRHRLHAKLYLAHLPGPITPTVGFLGSSNLTLAGLSEQGELNVDVLDHDACRSLQRWFDDRWADRWCLDISEELADIIDSSWAREEAIPPYHIYLKMAYHLSQEARAGLSEFRIPREFGNELFPFQVAAVKIAAHHLNKRGGVLIGDVVGLGKTLMATALARIFQEDQHTETLIICPKNLTPMWQDHVDRYRLIARVLPLSQALQELPEHVTRHRVVLIDESHNLRNTEGRRYRAIRDYIKKNESRCILLSATPYNKSYLDLSAQLALFVPEDLDLGIRPDTLLREMGELEFSAKHQCPVRSLAAFEKSPYPDDWRELMRLYMVRRTRSFIQDNYAQTDPATGRKYLTYADGRRSYFPLRQPRTVTFPLQDGADDQYARLYSPTVVNAIDALTLPRYGLGNYVAKDRRKQATAAQQAALADLSRAGKRLMGFCRTNLFKRLESGGPAFIQSVERHILRNYVFLHAIEQGLDLPVGTQEAAVLDPRSDRDPEGVLPADPAEDEEAAPDEAEQAGRSAAEFQRAAAAVYAGYTRWHRGRFKWLPSILFTPALRRNLQGDADALLAVLNACGAWDPGRDAKLTALTRLIQQTHPQQKLLIFTQFADTVTYLSKQLGERGVRALSGVTGASVNPTALAWRFSPVSNGKRGQVQAQDELRVLVATDVLSEGQNLQDCAIVVNYDLPWAIIRLIQRAGRVDRIGQQASEILCYSFLPAKGVERIINLRSRVRQRLHENAEVVGADESFFEDDMNLEQALALYHEQAGIMDGDAEGEVDLASYAYQIWHNATKDNPALRKQIEGLPNVVFSTRRHSGTPEEPEGVLLYMRTADGNDALGWLDQNGEPVTESPLRVLRAAECTPTTPAIARDERHHALVEAGVQRLAEENPMIGGQLGRPTGARYRTYERLKAYAQRVQGMLFDLPELQRAVDDIYRFPLTSGAIDTLNRQLRSGIGDADLAELVMRLRDDDRLSIVQENTERREPQIITSLGLFTGKGSR